MARARAIETRLEQLVPSMEEYFVVGAFTRPQLKEIVRTRTHHEYRLVANPLLLLDVRNAIAYEESIERRVAEHCAASKVIMKHRWVVIDRIEKIYQIGLRRLRNPAENEALRGEYIRFLRKHERRTSLSKHFARMIQRYPMKPQMWVEGALWEMQCGNVENARDIVLQAQRTLTKSADIYITALSVELEFARSCIRELQKAAEKETPEGVPFPDIAAGLAEENEASHEVVVKLALARIVFESAVEAGALTPEFVQRSFATLQRYPFAGALVPVLIERACGATVKKLEMRGAGVNAVDQLAYASAMVEAILVGTVNAAVAGIRDAVPFINMAPGTGAMSPSWAVACVLSGVAAALLLHSPPLAPELQRALHRVVLHLATHEPLAADVAVVSNVMRHLVVEADAPASVAAIDAALRTWSARRDPEGDGAAAAASEAREALERICEAAASMSQPSSGTPEPAPLQWELESVLPLVAVEEDRAAIVDGAAASLRTRALTREDVRKLVERALVVASPTAAGSSSSGGGGGGTALDAGMLEEQLRRVEEGVGSRGAAAAAQAKDVVVEAWPLYCLRITAAAARTTADGGVVDGGNDNGSSSSSSSSDDDSDGEAEGSSHQLPSTGKNAHVVAATTRGLRAVGRIAHGALVTVKSTPDSPAFKRLAGLLAISLEGVGTVLRCECRPAPAMIAAPGLGKSLHEVLAPSAWLHRRGRVAFRRALEALDAHTGERATAIAACEGIFRVATSFPPVSRELVMVAIAFSEAALLATPPAQRPRNALNAIRSRYDMALAAPLGSVQLGVPACALEAQDWVARVDFERSVAQDFVAAKAVVERGIKKVQDPRALQAALTC